jgi:hypothetical protein
MKALPRIALVASILGTLLFALVVDTHAALLSDLAKPQEGRSRRESSAHRIGADGKYDPQGEPDPNSNWDQKDVPPGKTQVLMDRQGPGAVTHIWMTFLTGHKLATPQDMLLRITYDGDERPGVEAPVGDFFANGFGERREVISLPVMVEGADSYNCFWRMPFRKSIRIEIVNQGRHNLACLYYNVDWDQLDSLPDDTPYFYAQYRQEYPLEKGKDYVVLDTQGKGHFVGTVLSVRLRSPSWFGEGDEKIYIDGEEKASIWGTGTEDYFLSAWGLATTSTPYSGTPYFDQWGIVGGHMCAYRWHVNDPIVFQKGIRVTLEHYGWISPDENPDYKEDSWNEREDDFSSVAFWYQTGKPTFAARAPGARERRLPNLDQVFPAGAALDPKRHGKGIVEKQRFHGYPDGQLFYKPPRQKGAWIEIPFEVTEKEPVRLLLNATRSDDYGKYQAYLNGVKIGDVLDFYNKDTENWEFHLLDFWPEPGSYTLRLECVGKNSASSQHWLGIESVRLRERRPRVAEWAHDKNKDWRKNPILYR